MTPPIPPSRTNGAARDGSGKDTPLRTPAYIPPNLSEAVGTAGPPPPSRADRLRKLLARLYNFVLTITGIVIIIVMLILLMDGVQHLSTVAILSLGGCFIWALIYQQVIDIALPSDMPVAPTPGQPRTGPATVELSNAASVNVTRSQTDRARMLLRRYGVAVISVALGVFSGVLLLGRYGLLEETAVLFPVVALFPFSYLAYVTFQRPIRIQRLKRDFELLAARWDEGLYQQSQGFWNFALHIILTILMTIVGAIVFFLPIFGLKPLDLAGIGMTEEVLRAMRFGFVGAYLFSAQLVYRRYTTYDLQPYVYMYCTLSIFAGLVINFAAFQTIYGVSTRPETIEGLGGGLLDVLAFALGFFPLLAVQWLTRIAYSALGQVQRRSDILRLDLIDGISQFHEVRLKDNGIDNIQNLASVDIPFLLINSTFSAQQVIDWVDQAILYLYLEPGDIESFRRGRVRTVSDFRDMWGPLMLTDEQVRGDENPAVDPTVQRIRTTREDKALQLQTNTQQLDLLFKATDRGPNLHYIINYWNNSDTLLPRWINSKYNEVLQDVFYAENDVSPDLLDSFSKQVEDYEKESDGKVVARSGAALAGLGRLAHHAYLHKPQNQIQHLQGAITDYANALRANRDVDKRVIAWLKVLADDNITLAVKEADTASKLTDAEKAAHIERAERLIQQAIDVSRLFYASGTPNVGYLADLAQLQLSLGKRLEARETLRQASEVCKTLDKPLLADRVNRLIAEAGTDIPVNGNGANTPQETPDEVVIVTEPPQPDSPSN
jgi:hypothetical protein